MNLGYVDKLGICLNLHDKNRSQELKRVNPDPNIFSKNVELTPIFLFICVSWEYVDVFYMEYVDVFQLEYLDVFQLEYIDVLGIFRCIGNMSMYWEYVDVFGISTCIGNM